MSRSVVVLCSFNSYFSCRSFGNHLRRALHARLGPGPDRVTPEELAIAGRRLGGRAARSRGLRTITASSAALHQILAARRSVTVARSLELRGRPWRAAFLLRHLRTSRAVFPAGGRQGDPFSSFCGALPNLTLQRKTRPFVSPSQNPDSDLHSDGSDPLGDPLLRRVRETQRIPPSSMWRSPSLDPRGAALRDSCPASCARLPESLSEPFRQSGRSPAVHSAKAMCSTIVFGSFSSNHQYFRSTF